MNMTDPKILDAERNGMPEAEPEFIECPSCGRCTYRENLRRCEKCKEEICVSCPQAIWICAYGWHFCCSECAIAYLVAVIQEQDEEIFKLKQESEAKHG